MSLKRISLFAILMLFISTTSIMATTVKVSQQSGNSLQKLKNAYNKAKFGDVILLDVDVYFGNNDGPVVFSKSGITLRGGVRASGKYKLNRAIKSKVTLKVIASNVTIDNVMFVNATQQLLFGSGSGTASNVVIKNCYFKNAGYTGIDFRGKFSNTKITDCQFENSKFSLQTFDCPVLNGFKVEGCKFYGGDHQLSLDNPNATIANHSNIVINDCKFYKCDRFNIALANTRNVKVSNCYMEGGKGAYSQALHIEDRTTNVYAVKNTIKCAADVAVIIYSTDKFGHGTGARLSYAQKVNYGSGNVTLDNNYIESGNKDAAILVGFGKGYLRIYGNNTIVSGNRGINSFESKNRMSFEINNNAKIKGKTYSQIKAISNPVIKKQYVNLN